MECNLSREKSGAKERIENNGSGMSVIYTERMLQVVATCAFSVRFPNKRRSPTPTPNDTRQPNTGNCDKDVHR